MRSSTVWRSVFATGASIGLACPVEAQVKNETDEAAAVIANGPIASGGLQDIIVTAQRRSESVNKVGMSITAITGDQLASQAIVQPRDLVKLVPGLSVAPSPSGVPIYTIRGIGYFNQGLQARPTVSVYVDEIPLPFPIQTLAAGLDLERAEVLKGPQGTLYGQNSTGGAINFISAKPTEETHAGLSVYYGRFNAVNARGFVSGNLGSNLTGRLALAYEHLDPWQRSYTRDDSLGRSNRLTGRVLLNWKPTDGLRFLLNLNGWKDKGDNQALALSGFITSRPRLPLAVAAYPLAPHDNRAADWGPSNNLIHNQHFLQSALRTEYDVDDNIMLTALSSYSEFHRRSLNDSDGTSLPNFEVATPGSIKSLYQEIRLSGDTSGFRWIVGGNYERDHVVEEADVNQLLSSNAASFITADALADSRQRMLAAFVNLDWAVTDTLTLQGGARYTDYRDVYAGCAADTGDGRLAASVAAAGSTLAGRRITIPAGGCATLDENFVPGLIHRTLKEDNVSWRVGANWQVSPTVLLYANVGRGFKAGGFQVSGVTFSAGLDPARQESVLAYEAGFKVQLADRKVQLNGALFYYDYSDKQIRSRVADPVLGRINKLINVPDSRVQGGEISLVTQPFTGFRLSTGLSYQSSRIRGSFITGNALGVLQQVGGEAFPLTPKVQANADASYEWPLGASLVGLIGTTINYQSATNSGLGNLATLDIGNYTLVDIRAGLKSDQGWSATAFVRNLTDKYYWTSVSFASPDTLGRFTGMPRTYGLELAYRF